MFIEAIGFQKPGLEIRQLGNQTQVDGYFDDGSHVRIWLKLPEACQILLDLRLGSQGKKNEIDIGGLEITYTLHEVKFVKEGKTVKVPMPSLETALEEELTPIFLKAPSFEAWLKEETKKV